MWGARVLHVRRMTCRSGMAFGVHLTSPEANPDYSVPLTQPQLQSMLEQPPTILNNLEPPTQPPTQPPSPRTPTRTPRTSAGRTGIFLFPVVCARQLSELAGPRSLGLAGGSLGTITDLWPQPFRTQLQPEARQQLGAE